MNTAQTAATPKDKFRQQAQVLMEKINESYKSLPDNQRAEILAEISTLIRSYTYRVNKGTAEEKSRAETQEALLNADLIYMHAVALNDNDLKANAIELLTSLPEAFSFNQKMAIHIANLDKQLEENKKLSPTERKLSETRFNLVLLNDPDVDASTKDPIIREQIITATAVRGPVECTDPKARITLARECLELHIIDLANAVRTEQLSSRTGTSHAAEAVGKATQER